MSEKIVGHKTFWNDDGTHRHEPLLESEADELWKQAGAEKERRKELIPDEQTALKLMLDCCTRLREMGWRSPPKFTTKQGKYKFKVIEFGSTGIFDVTSDVGENGEFRWWHASHGDVYPITPLMVKEVTEA